jgi:hypothetical protein
VREPPGSCHGLHFGSEVGSRQKHAIELSRSSLLKTQSVPSAARLRRFAGPCCCDSDCVESSPRRPLAPLKPSAKNTQNGVLAAIFELAAERLSEPAALVLWTDVALRLTPRDTSSQDELGRVALKNKPLQYQHSRGRAPFSWGGVRPSTDPCERLVCKNVCPACGRDPVATSHVPGPIARVDLRPAWPHNSVPSGLPPCYCVFLGPA